MAPSADRGANPPLGIIEQPPPALRPIGIVVREGSAAMVVGAVPAWITPTSVASSLGRHFGSGIVVASGGGSWALATAHAGSVTRNERPKSSNFELVAVLKSPAAPNAASFCAKAK